MITFSAKAMMMTKMKIIYRTELNRLIAKSEHNETIHLFIDYTLELVTFSFFILPHKRLHLYSITMYSASQNKKKNMILNPPCTSPRGYGFPTGLINIVMKPINIPIPKIVNIIILNDLFCS